MSIRAWRACGASTTRMSSTQETRTARSVAVQERSGPLAWKDKAGLPAGRSRLRTISLARGPGAKEKRARERAILDEDA